MSLSEVVSVAARSSSSTMPALDQALDRPRRDVVRGQRSTTGRPGRRQADGHFVEQALV